MRPTAQWCELHDSLQADVWPKEYVQANREGQAYCHRWLELWNEETDPKTFRITCRMVERQLLPLDARVVEADALVIEDVDWFVGEFGLRLHRYSQGTLPITPQRATTTLLNLVDEYARSQSVKGLR
jgi:hypothetical protein